MFDYLYFNKKSNNYYLFSYIWNFQNRFSIIMEVTTDFFSIAIIAFLIIVLVIILVVVIIKIVENIYKSYKKNARRKARIKVRKLRNEAIKRSRNL